ncbi:peptide chain release factor N(5)-glutamine methyltransferase [Desulfolucanica intricata]|uniref:peptide chain release factor N(5)-glutamine methyltransferase n=1 Tax=Desulfolucanica intricata TaxID=1285191 RepID=UPI0008316CD4|nr:peptide chain release factor N(5)-glutamine methyltransferase [Desulfolucanica intricata]
MNIREALARAGAFLTASCTGLPALDAEVLMMHLLGTDRTGLYLNFDQLLTDEQVEKYRNLIERRSQGEPVAYLTGHKEFMGLDFTVSPAVLVPRPETELLVEKALKLLPEQPGKTLIAVDVGTGSGAIAVSLAKLNAHLEVYAVDYSTEALSVARQNAVSHGVDGRIHYYHGDLLTPLIGLELNGRVDLIAANLPYIPSSDMPGLPVDVRLYEPHLALDGGRDGLDLYRRLLPVAGEFLRTGGHLLMEIGPGQGDVLSRELAGLGWGGIEVLPDYTGRERLVVAMK